MVETIRITDVASLIRAAQIANDFFKEGFCWWRGEGCIRDTWDLTPKIYRQSFNEQKLALAFLNRAQVRYPKCPDRENWPSWLFLMQHYGLATRLLDWTESPLTALYFSVNEETDPNDNGNLWCLQPCRLNLKSGLKEVASPQEENVFELCWDVFGQERPSAQQILAVMADHFDIRHLVQSAAFTIHGLSQPLNEYAQDQNCLLQFEVLQARNLTYATN
ncbi:MAG: FRG domain-containing protein [Nitrospira sp.]|nr:FRG domain-containing protein [Nitrospira sp.]